MDTLSKIYLPLDLFDDSAVYCLKEYTKEYTLYLNYSKKKVPEFKDIIESVRSSFGLLLTIANFKYFYVGWKLNFPNDKNDYSLLFEELESEFKKINFNDYDCVSQFTENEELAETLDKMDEIKTRYLDKFKKFINFCQKNIKENKIIIINNGNI